MKHCVDFKNNKGFAKIELVLVIAVLVLLAAVTVPTILIFNAKNNEYAEVQEKNNQQLAALAEMIEKNQQSASLEDLDSMISQKLSEIEVSESISNEDLANAINAALAEYESKHQNDSNGLTEEQVKSIVEGALKGQLTTDQVQAIVDAAIKSIEIPQQSAGLTAADVEKIVSDAVKEIKIPEAGLSAEDVKNAIDASIEEAFKNVNTGISMEDIQATIDASLENALENAGKDVLTPEQIKELIDQAIAEFNQQS